MNSLTLKDYMEHSKIKNANIFYFILYNHSDQIHVFRKKASPFSKKLKNVNKIYQEFCNNAIS